MKEEINIKNEEILNMSNSNKSNDLFDNSFEDERIIDISTHFQQEIAISKKIAQLEKNISSQKLGLITLENNPNKDNEQIIRIKNNLNETTKSLQTLYQQKSIMIQNRKKIQDIIIVYAHCKKLFFKEGQTVKQGQEIAEVGSTGNSTGPHLHFEIRKNGRKIDPQLVLDL